MGQARVPCRVNMVITGKSLVLALWICIWLVLCVALCFDMFSRHKNKVSYSQYDRSSESKIRVAQRCIADGSMTYEDTSCEERRRSKANLVNGDICSNMT